MGLFTRISAVPHLGLLRLFSEPQLQVGQVKIGGRAAEAHTLRAEDDCFLGVAALDADSRTVEVLAKPSRHIVRFSLHDASDVLLADGPATGKQSIAIAIPTDIALDQVRSLRLMTSDGVVLSAWIHSSTAIEPLAAGNVREQVKRALVSLTSDEGNLAEVIDAVHKVIFSDEPELALRGQPNREDIRSESATPERVRPETLAVPAASIGRRSKKLKVLRSGDLAYLIDVLVRKLALPRDASVDLTDRQGRSEEEQIGADDEAPATSHCSSTLAAIPDHELALLIRRKVKRLVGRMSRYLEEAAKEDKRLPMAIPRLIAVLALVRELRRIESQSKWRTAGCTLVGLRERADLFETASRVLLGEKSALLRRFEEIAGPVTEEAGQVRSLMMWLAWDVGHEYTEKFSLSLEADEANALLHANAVLFELLPLVATDADDLEAMKESIVLTGAKALPARSRQQFWIDRHVALGRKWGQIKATLPTRLAFKAELERGDIAIAVTDSKHRPRVVARVTDSIVDLATIDGVVSYRRDCVGYLG